ncbi:MAG: adenylate/guanylate cyclase domain-containing protein [Methylobacteriaceae bacterium]|nr:adenylate/guanylate cyclase domain-containing protein [Methylobacteriaceae bacterium]
MGEARAGAGHELDALLREADCEAERRVSLVRMGAAAILFAGVFAVTSPSDYDLPGIGAQIRAAQVTLVLLFAAGLVAWLVIRAGRWRPGVTYLTIAVDVAILSGNLAVTLDAAGLTGDFAAVAPIVGVFPALLAASALRLRPAVQAFTTVLVLVALVAVAAHAGFNGLEVRRALVGELAPLYGPPPNVIRLLMIALAGGILVLAASRGRKLLRRAEEEGRRRANLGRFLPNEVTPLLADGRFDELTAGRRSQVALLFVDIRGSTRLEETLPPSEVVALIGGFRAVVSQAAREHGGVVDKFMGDGAFLVFGVPDAHPDDSRRALACAVAIRDAMAGRNAGTPGREPVRIGVGVHAGEAFVGAIGDDSRLEFTVLGDAVNLASRIEQATKAYGEPVLASREAVVRAGLLAEWRPVACATLPGRAVETELYAPGA